MSNLKPVKESYPVHRVLTDEELAELQEKYILLCPGFGSSYNPRKVCKRCGVCMLCFTAQTRKLPAKIEAFRKKIPGKYFLHEYVDTVFKPGHLEELVETFVAAIKGKGEPVTLEKLESNFLNPESKWYYVDYFKTHDPRIPSLLLKRLALDKRLKLNPTNKTLSYVGK